MYLNTAGGLVVYENKLINRNKSCIWILLLNLYIKIFYQINRNKSCIWISNTAEHWNHFERLIETRVVFEFCNHLVYSSNGNTINRNKSCIWMPITNLLTVSLLRLIETRVVFECLYGMVQTCYARLIETRVVFE